MSLIAMCAYCTEENGKVTYLKQTLESIERTVDWGKHRLWVTDNSPTDIASDLLIDLMYKIPATITARRKNIGTAEGINLAIADRSPGEFVIKCDDDWTTEQVGWVDEMERVMSEHPEIGILGLKRDDVYGELIPDGELLWNKDIMGTCTILNPKLLDRVGYYFQPSGTYGYDDNLLSVRSEVAGFKNAFMRNIRIVNLDVGGTQYTEWKKREAGAYATEASIICGMYRDKTLDIYYNPFE